MCCAVASSNPSCPFFCPRYCINYETDNNKDENEHTNKILFDNCKTEADKLIGTAKSVQALEKQTAAAKGYDSVKVNSNGTVTGTITQTGSRIPKTITCDAHGKCTN